MHFLHFLLLTSIALGESQTVPKVKFPMCRTNRKCYAPDTCISSTSTSTELTELAQYTDIKGNCAAIVLFRVFTKKKWVMRLESLDPEITKMEFGQGNVKFECEIVDSAVSAKFNNAEQELSSRTMTPLMCEFRVKTDAEEIFPKDDITKFSLTFTKGTKSSTFTTAATPFQFLARPTCDPDDVEHETAIEFGEKMLKNVIEKEYSMDLICPADYTMTLQIASNTVIASSIDCKESGIVYSYSAVTEEKTTPLQGKIKARCERLKCEMCSTILPKPNCAKTSIFKIENEENSTCQQLKCISGKIKIDDSMNRPPYAPCKYINGQHVFAVHSTFGNHHVIDDNADAQCIEKEECGSKERQLAEKACEDCVMDRYNQPACSKGTTLTLKRSADDIRVNVYCDDSKGELVWRAVDSAGAEHRLIESEKLYCALPPKPKAPDCSAFFTQAQMDEKVDSGSLPWKISTGVLLLVIVGLLGVGCWMYSRPPACKRRHKRDEFDTIKVEDLRDSKESKKEETSHTGRDVTPVEAQKPALSSPLGTTADQSGTKTSRAVAEDGKTAESATKSSRTFRSEEGNNKKKKPSTGGASAVTKKPNKEA